VAIPEPGLALAARLWTPDGADLAAPYGRGPAGFTEAGDGPPGHLVVVKLGAPPRAGAPALVQLRAAAGRGDYAVVALGPGSASGAQVLARVRALADAGRAAPALELAAAFVTAVPAAAARDEVLLLAGGVAERAAASLPPEALGEFDRASQLLGAAVLEAVDGKVRYPGAFAAPAR
jgi:hypothetical protein